LERKALEHHSQIDTFGTQILAVMGLNKQQTMKSIGSLKPDLSNVREYLKVIEEVI
jgi:hypothetical protein